MKNRKPKIEVQPAVVEVPAVAAKIELNENLVSRWLKFLGRSPKTCETYSACVRQLFRYFASNNINKPRREDLENWRDELIAAGKSPNTVCLYLTSCKLLFRWLSFEGFYPNVADHLSNRVRIDRGHKKDVLDAKQSSKLLKAVKGDSLKAKRDRAILAILLTAGLRTIEIERANIQDLRRVNGFLFLFVCGKGRTSKTESVRIAPQVEKLIREYLQARGKVADNASLFASCARRNFGERITTQTIRKMVKANLRAIGLDSKMHSAHSCRHSAALQMLLAGAKLEEVQMVLRHVSISTTQIYNHSITRLKNQSECLAAEAVFGAMNFGE